MVDRIPSLGVIVVHFGQPALTLRCIQHLQNQRGIDLEVVLVDNSPHGDAPTFQDLGLRMETIRCSNHGFAHANNQGLALLRSASVEGVLLLNNDAFALEGALNALWSTINNIQRPGLAVMAGGCLLNEDGTLQTRGGCWLPKLGHGLVLKGDSCPKDGVVYASGAALLLNREALERLNWQLDEGYFLYFEEVDTAERLRKAGPLEVVLEEKSQFIHLQGALAGSGKRHHDRSVRSEFHFHRSKRRFYSQHYPRYLPKMHFLHVLVVLKRLFQGNIGRAMAVIRGFWGR